MSDEPAGGAVAVFVVSVSSAALAPPALAPPCFFFCCCLGFASVPNAFWQKAFLCPVALQLSQVSLNEGQWASLSL